MKGGPVRRADRPSFWGMFPGISESLLGSDCERNLLLGPDVGRKDRNGISCSDSRSYEN